MPQANSLSDPEEAALLAIWKLRGIGTKQITEEQLRAETTNQPPASLPSALNQLQSQGFIEIAEQAGRKSISITPLGVAILRKVEEDRLQEIK